MNTAEGSLRLMLAWVEYDRIRRAARDEYDRIRSDASAEADPVVAYVAWLEAAQVIAAAQARYYQVVAEVRALEEAAR